MEPAEGRVHRREDDGVDDDVIDDDDGLDDDGLIDDIDDDVIDDAINNGLDDGRWPVPVNIRKRFLAGSCVSSISKTRRGFRPSITD
jgi:hypothetical protein